MRQLFVLASLVLLFQQNSRLSAQNITEESLRHELASHAMPLHTSGQAILLKEAEEHQYFLLGELHGETEVPDLISDLWPSLWQAGYRHVAAEVSPWAATHLQKPATEDATRVPGLWTRKQATEILRFARPGQSILWGCDMEEEQPGHLISQMAQLNPTDARLRSMQEMISNGYSRKQAPTLLQLAKSDHPANDTRIGGESLWKSMLDTLQIEVLRSDPHTRYAASDAREHLMKALFLTHVKQEPQGKVLLRFENRAAARILGLS